MSEPEPALKGADDLFLRWWKSQSLDGEPERSRLIAKVAFKAGILSRVAGAAPIVRDLYSRLVQLAAAVIAGHDFISPDADDNPKSTPRAILDQAEKQKERLRVWAIEIREIADALIAIAATAAPVEQNPGFAVAAVEEDVALIEALAALAHEQWSGWMNYMFDTCTYKGHRPDGFMLVLPTEYGDRWLRQISTSYADLPESEKESDRKEARRMVEVFRATAATAAPTVIHWRFKSGVEETMCGIAVQGVRVTILQDYATCERCKAAAFGYQIGRADERAAASSSLPAEPPPHGNAIIEMMAGTCAVGWMDCSVVQWLAGVKYFIEEEARKPNGDTHLINTLRRAACMAWEASQFAHIPITPAEPPLNEHYFIVTQIRDKCGYSGCELGPLDHPEIPQHNFKPLQPESEQESKI